MFKYLLHRLSPYLYLIPPMDDPEGGSDELPPDPGADDDAAEDDPPEPKSPPAKAKAKADPPAPKVKDDPTSILSNPLVKAELAKAARIAAKQAREEAAAEAAQAAERAQMEETERLRLEKTEADNAKAAAKADADRAGRKANMYKAVLDGKYALQDGGSDYLEFSVEKLMAADPDLDIADAVAKTLEGSPFLLAPAPAAPAAPVVQDPAGEEKKPPATTGKVQHHSQTKSVEKKVEVIDTLSMTPAEYRVYKAANHGRR